MGVLVVHRFLGDCLFILAAAVAFLHLHISEIITLPLFPPSLLLREPPLPWWRQRSGMARQTEPPYCSRHTHTHTQCSSFIVDPKWTFTSLFRVFLTYVTYHLLFYFIFLRNVGVIFWFKWDKLLFVGVSPLQKAACVWQVAWWGLYVVCECRCHMMQF